MGEYEIELEGLQDPLAWLTDPNEPDAHREVLDRPERVVPVTGSGISVPLGYPAGDGLATVLDAIGRAAGLGDEDLAITDPRSIADVLIARGAIERDELLHRVADLYSGVPVGTSEVVDRLLFIRSQLLFTLNYDPSLEIRANELGIEHASLVLSRDTARVLELLVEPANRQNLAIVHAHGIASDPSSIVLDRQGYGDLLNTPHVDFVLRLLTSARRLLFIGTRLDELHFLSRLVELQVIHKRHLFVATTETVLALRAARVPLIAETYLLLIRGYGDHADLVPLVELLIPSAEEVPATPAEAGPVFATVEAAPPADYVETLMLERRDARDDQLDASFLFAVGLRSPIALEQVAAEGARTLIEGLPGSGKSTLLVEIGGRQPANVVALRLRAPELEFVGDANLLLPRWLETASAFRDGERRDPERLDAELFHFLIDGLDEVPHPRQELAAKRIAEVAAANPTHNFTVASRSIPSLERFARPEWVHVALAPGGNWREAYLERRGVNWEELTDAAPLLKDLRGLLDLPFFLSQTIDLYERGELADASDLLTLVARFVDAALREVEKTIPAEVVRPWLRQLALGMALAGRTEVSVDEVAASLPEELAAYGDAVAVAERLVSARLFGAGGDRMYGFVHRIFGEVLAAEALLGLEPEESGILDVAAPRVTDRIRGLRSDWLVPITVVATASAEWRRALAFRDPLAAARAIPIDAPAEEREQAARLIWQTYVDWRIWLSDYKLSAIVEDEAVLARLLATEGLEELQAQIHAAISTGSREDIGNAIKVLANLGDSTIEADLRNVLETSEDPTLRRVAGLAARDLRLDALYYLIAHRALHTTESTEAQDLTYATIGLAPTEDLVTFARRAARKGGEPMFILSHAIQGRISARDELSVLRAWASRRADPLSSQRERLVELLAGLPMEEADVVEEVIFVAGSWKLENDELKDLVRQHQVAAVRAIMALEREEAAYNFEYHWILAEIDLEHLAEQGAPESMIQAKERLETWKEARSE